MKYNVNLCILTGILFFIQVDPSFSKDPFPIAPYFVKAKEPTPVFNTSGISLVFGGDEKRTLKLDKRGHIRALEYIALKNTVFKVKNEIIDDGVQVFNVDTDEYYVPGAELYIDSRFVEVVDKECLPRRKVLPAESIIKTRMMDAVGDKYVWGGNIRGGVPKMLRYYPSKEQISDEIKDKWILNGLDCSGLLYYATDGYTPRNTGSLLLYGSAVDIEGLNTEQIADKLEPLDLIVLKGHVIIVLDEYMVIESRPRYADGYPGGVRVRPLKLVLREIHKKRKPGNVYADGMYVVRRWYETEKDR